MASHLQNWTVPVPAWVFILLALAPWGVFLAGLIGLQISCLDGSEPTANPAAASQQASDLDTNGGAHAPLAAPLPLDPSPWAHACTTCRILCLQPALADHGVAHAGTARKMERGRPQPCPPAPAAAGLGTGFGWSANVLRCNNLYRVGTGGAGVCHGCRGEVQGCSKAREGQGSGVPTPRIPVRPVCPTCLHAALLAAATSAFPSRAALATLTPHPSLPGPYGNWGPACSTTGSSWA